MCDFTGRQKKHNSTNNANLLTQTHTHTVKTLSWLVKTRLNALTSFRPCGNVKCINVEETTRKKTNTHHNHLQPTTQAPPIDPNQLRPSHLSARAGGRVTQTQRDEPSVGRDPLSLWAGLTLGPACPQGGLSQ